MPIIPDQSIFRDDSEWLLKIDSKYHDNISPGKARNFFENFPSKRLLVYLKEDLQGQLFDEFNRCQKGYYKDNWFFLNAAKEDLEIAKIILSIPDLFQRLSMTNLIKVVFFFPEETTQLFLKNSPKYNSIYDVVDFISKQSEDMFDQEKVLRFVLENPRLYKRLGKESLGYIVDGCRYSQGSGDSTKSYKTKGEMIEIILEYAKKDSKLRQKLNSSQLSEWAHYVGRRSYCERSYYIDTIFESPELIKILCGEDLAQLFLSRELGSHVDMKFLKNENLLNKFIEARTDTLEEVLKKSTFKELNELIGDELKCREDKETLRTENEKRTELSIPSWFFSLAHEKDCDTEINKIPSVKFK